MSPSLWTARSRWCGDGARWRALSPIHGKGSTSTPTTAVDANFFNVGTTLFGLGNPGFSNATCLVTTPFSFAGNTPADCIANNRTLSDVTVGFWQDAYKGAYGRVAFGAQYEFLKRKAFVGIGGDPSTDHNLGLASVRYYPF